MRTVWFIKEMIFWNMAYFGKSYAAEIRREIPGILLSLLQGASSSNIELKSVMSIRPCFRKLIYKYFCYQNERGNTIRSQWWIYQVKKLLKNIKVVMYVVLLCCVVKTLPKFLQQMQEIVFWLGNLLTRKRISGFFLCPYKTLYF